MTATMTAARRRLALRYSRTPNAEAVRTYEVPTGYPYTNEIPTVRAGVVGAVR